jgi:uroporphyrinogen decarboxylase
LTSLLLDALAGRDCPRPPIWLMRQAGRYLPEYRKVRQQFGGFLELCYTPEFAVEVTHQPIRRYGLDAAILFSDILVVPDALGCKVTFVEGEGPRLETVRTRAALERLTGMDRLHEHLAPVYETVRRLRATLPEDVALIGFAGAPWTVAAYMVEGGGSKEYLEPRLLARTEPELFQALIDLVTEATTRYLLRQIEAGAQVLQIFDSWAGVLPPDQFLRWCQQPVARIVDRIKADHPEIPIIAFPRGAGFLYQRFVEQVTIDGVSLDSTVPAGWARDSLSSVCLQGNLDPVLLLEGGSAMLDGARHLLDRFAGRRHIFNLGHGVLPPTDPDAVARLVDFVRDYRPEPGTD